jgi:serine phosphatase RsbU (regulator of sigma subunit)
MRLAATFLILLSSSTLGSQLQPPSHEVSTEPVATPAAQGERAPERINKANEAEIPRPPEGQDAPKQRFATAATKVDLIHIGAALAFSLLHLLLFAFFRREQGNLYVAIFALAFAGMTWGGYRLDYPEAGADNSQLVATLRFTFTCGILQAYALLRFAYVVLLRRTPLVFYPLLAWGAGVVAWIWATPATTLRIQPVMYLALATTSELLRTVVLAARRPQRSGAWLIYVGLAALATAGALQSLLALGVFGSYNRPVYSYGVLFLLLAVSIYLSRRFATTTQELETQLEEVQRLSAKTLAQERQARRRELERRLLEAENERRAQELEEARRLQLSMLPRDPPTAPGLDIAFRMLTASEVGGDYYDFRIGEDGALTLAVGDATGHGLNAGIVVASSKSLFQGLDDGLSLSESLQRIDRGLRGMNLRRMGMSLGLARWERGSLHVAAAGMPPVLIFRRSSRQVEECLFSTPPLGTLEQRSFAERSIRLASGDAVLIATDGLVELLDPDDEPLGYPAVAEAFRRAAGAGAEHAVEGLLAATREWARGRPLADDLSLVVLRVE